MKQILLVITLLIAGVFSVHLYSNSVWVDRNLYSPDVDLAPGSLIVIEVNDITDLQFTLSFTSSKSGTVNSMPDTTITGFLPPVSSSKNFSSSDSGDYTSGGNMNFTIAATVIDTTPEGLYRVSGSRAYIFDGRRNILSVGGLIDSTLIKGRSIDSSQIANFTIELSVSSETMNITRPPLEEDETADYNLTEQEKQDMIIDYLEKMLSEIGR